MYSNDQLIWYCQQQTDLTPREALLLERLEAEHDYATDTDVVTVDELKADLGEITSQLPAEDFLADITSAIYETLNTKPLKNDLTCCLQKVVADLEDTMQLQTDASAYAIRTARDICNPKPFVNPNKKYVGD